MDNVPSSAILAIVAIVLACLFAAFVFAAVQSQKSSGSNAVSQVNDINAKADEEDLMQYDGQTLMGSQVIEALKKNKDVEGLIMSVQNAKAEVYQGQYFVELSFYGNNYHSGKVTLIQKELARYDFVPVPTLNITILYRDAESGGSNASPCDYLYDVPIIELNTEVLKLINNKNFSGAYINPHAQFVATVHHRKDTQAIDWIEFTQTNQTIPKGALPIYTAADWYWYPV